MKKTIFLDRDGCIIEDAGFIDSPRQVRFFPYTFEALKLLRRRFHLVIVTNQSGIEKGLISDTKVKKLNQYIVDKLKTNGVPIEAVYYCPHASGNCRCKKPKPYFLHQYAKESGNSLNGCYSVGDHPSDVQLAENVGGKGIYILTGHGKKHSEELPPGTLVRDTLLEAAHFILEDNSNA